MRSVLITLTLIFTFLLIVALIWGYWYFYVRQVPETQRKWTDPKLANADRDMNKS